MKNVNKKEQKLLVSYPYTETRSFLDFAGTMKVGESALIEVAEWPNISTPTNVLNRFRNVRRYGRFITRTLSDYSGWIVTKVSNAYENPN